MEFETWWLLLLPMFFAAGWFAARWDLRQTIQASRKLPATYFKGLNHLLHDEQDQALEALIDVVKLDPDTPELHFALGALFRRRGETERAIRVHENLISRRDLAPAYQQQARLELGLDFIKAGLLSQAEDALKPLEGTPLAVAAEEQRILLAQGVRDWPLAIQMAQALRAAGNASSAKHEVHYHCNMLDELLAKQPITAETVAKAEALLAHAQACNATHPRVSLAKILVAKAKLDDASIVSCTEELGREHPAYLPLVLDDYVEAADRLDRDLPGFVKRAFENVQAWWKVAPSQDFLFSLISKQKVEPWAGWIQKVMVEKPSTRFLEKWLANNDNIQLETAASTVLPVIAEQLKLLNSKPARYACKSCGFQARSHYWQCPGCHQWETYAAITDASRP
jgi:lipopolysaccharide assembly protein B